MNTLSERVGRIVPRLIAPILLLGLAFVAFEWNAIRAALAEASWRPIPYALAASGISYFCISLSFARVNRLLNVNMRNRDLMAVGFVSVVLNHIVSSGGAAGYSVRYALMDRYGVAPRDVVATSILHFTLTSLVMVAMLPVGLLYLLTHAAIGGGTAGLLTGLAAVVILADLIAVVLAFSGPLRSRLFGFLEGVARSILHRELGPTLERFDASMTAGAGALRRRPAELVGIMILVAADWAASAAALWFCLRAFGVSLTPGQLITGFVIGIVAGVASMVPGGLGVQEGSMAGVFSLLGVALDRAALASILFRAIYYVIPYLISLGFYRRLLRRHGDGWKAIDWEVGHAHPDA